MTYKANDPMAGKTFRILSWLVEKGYAALWVVLFFYFVSLLWTDPLTGFTLWGIIAFSLLIAWVEREKPKK